MTPEQELELETRFFDAVRSQSGITSEELAQKLGIPEYGIRAGCEIAVGDGTLFAFQDRYYATQAERDAAQQMLTCSNGRTVDQLSPEDWKTLQDLFANAFTMPAEQLNGLRTDKAPYASNHDMIVKMTEKFADDYHRYEFLSAALITIVNISRYIQGLEKKIQELEKKPETETQPRLSTEQFQQVLAQLENQHREWCDMQERWHDVELKDGKEKSSSDRITEK
jgi:hypothetical protein